MNAESRASNDYKMYMLRRYHCIHDDDEQNNSRWFRSLLGLPDTMRQWISYEAAEVVFAPDSAVPSGNETRGFELPLSFLKTMEP